MIKFVIHDKYFGDLTVSYFDGEDEATELAAIELLLKQQVIGWDSETTYKLGFEEDKQAGLDPYRSRIRLSQFATKEKQIFIFDHFKISAKVEARLVYLLESILPVKTCHNGKFDVKMARHLLGVKKMGRIFDTELGYRLTQCGQYLAGRISLGDVSEKLLAVKLEKELQRSDWSVPNLTTDQLEYGARDAYILLPIRDELLKLIDDLKLRFPATLDFGCIDPVASLELTGFPINPQRWKVVDEQMRAKRINILEEIWEEFRATGVVKQQGLFKGAPLESRRAIKGAKRNSKTSAVTSPKKIAEYLERYGILLPKKTSKGKPTPVKTTSTPWLKPLEKQYKIIPLLLEFRELDKRKTSYGADYTDKNCSPITKRIHSDFDPLGAKTARFTSGKPNCFPAYVEVLTNSGWKTWDSIDCESDLIGQYNLEDSVISFTRPEQFVSYDFEGNLLRLKTELQIDLPVTSDHSCLLRHRKTRQFCKVPASEYKSDYQQICAGQYQSGGYTLSPEQVTLICALQADGHIVNTKNPYIDFVFAKKRKINRLTRALNTLGISYIKKPKGEQTRFYVPLTPQLREQKMFGSWLLQYDWTTLSLFAKEVLFWDGLWTRKSLYTSKHKSNCDWVQILWTLNGRRARVASRIVDEKVYWDTYIARKCYALTTNHQKIETPYTGKVFCVKVPDGNVIVRCNGKVAITGNTQQIPNMPIYRSCFVAPPGWKFVGGDFSQIELRIAAELSGDLGYIEAFLSGEDFHAKTAELMFHVDPKSPEGKRMRTYAKRINFGIIYGMGAGKLAMQTDLVESKDVLRLLLLEREGIIENANLWLQDKIENELVIDRETQQPRPMNKWEALRLAKPLSTRAIEEEVWATETAQDYLRMYKETFADLMAFLVACGKETARNRGIRMASGRLVKFWVKYEDKGSVAQAERNGMNTPIQGLAGEILKVAMRGIFDKICDAGLHDVVKLCHTVHDELQLLVRDDYVDWASRELEDSMVKAGEQFLKTVPVKADIKAGQEWLKDSWDGEWVETDSGTELIYKKAA